jgi:hypothetical protein
MEKVLLSMPLNGAEGAHLVAEVDPVDLAAVELVADDGDGHLVKAAGSLAEAFDKLEPTLEMIVSRVRSAARSPDEITVDFGLKLGGEAGFIFAKGTAEANLAVSVTWKHGAGRPEHEPGTP